MQWRSNGGRGGWRSEYPPKEGLQVTIFDIVLALTAILTICFYSHS